MMTGQPPGAKRVAILSARTPAQSRNSTLARSKTSRPVESSTARAACSRNLPVAGRSRSPLRMRVLQDQELSACVLKIVRKWEFEKPKSGGKLMVKYPFVFTPIAARQ